MDQITIIAASGLQARMDSLEMLANNLANAATGGYKTDREFYSLYAAPEAGDPNRAPATVPVIERPWTDFSQGMLQPTENELDLAISGKGFFAVNGPSGALYTRNGNFKLSPAGLLVTMEGYPVRASGGGTLQTVSTAPVEVSPDGSVAQAGQVLGQLEIADFADRSSLRKQGTSYFLNPDPKSAPTPAAGAEIHQGQLEASNVTPAEGAVRLVSLMRQFEMLQRAVSIGADMNRHAIEEVARPGA
jgi:flagellar basal-body rod protein FlgF